MHRTLSAAGAFWLAAFTYFIWGFTFLASRIAQDYGTPFVPWRAGRLDGPDIRVMARTCDEACIRARAISCDCTSFQRMD